LVGAIVLFEVIALLQIAAKPSLIQIEALIRAGTSWREILTVLFRSLDTDALFLAAALPVQCVISTFLLNRLLPIDQLLMTLTNFLCGVGVVILYSMLPEVGLRQALWYTLGLGAMTACSLMIRFVRDWKALCWLMMPVGAALLALPIVAGQWNNGAKNWVSVPLIGMFQPSEVVKLAELLILARFFSARRRLSKMLPAVVFIVGCLGMLLLQRDLGTALMYYLPALALYFVSTGNVLMTTAGLGGGAAAAIAGYHLFDHVRVRVAIWLNPWADALGKGYQIVQALMAIGSGSLFGLGLGLGLPRKIPAYHTDFIFAVICEQFGIVFGLCVVLIYIMILMRGFSIAMRSRQSFYALLAFGCTAMLGIQTFVIIAGVIKLIPLTGITLPLVSYGGTSLLSCMALIGLLQGVSSRVEADADQDIAIVEASEIVYQDNSEGAVAD